MTYEALEVGKSGNLVVPQLECGKVLIASQVSQIRAFDLIIGEFHLKHSKSKEVSVIVKLKSGNNLWAGDLRGLARVAQGSFQATVGGKC